MTKLCFKPRLTNCPRFLHNGPVIWYKYRHQLGLESNMFFGLNQVGSRFSCAAKFTSRDPFDWPSSDSRNIGSTVRYITWIFEHLHKITSVWVGDIPEKSSIFPGLQAPREYHWHPTHPLVLLVAQILSFTLVFQVCLFVNSAPCQNCLDKFQQKNAILT